MNNTKIVGTACVLLLMLGCSDAAYQGRVKIRNAEVLLENIAKECQGELTISMEVSVTPKLLATCVQTGPMAENAVITEKRGE